MAQKHRNKKYWYRIIQWIVGFRIVFAALKALVEWLAPEVVKGLLQFVQWEKLVDQSTNWIAQELTHYPMTIQKIVCQLPVLLNLRVDIFIFIFLTFILPRLGRGYRKLYAYLEKYMVSVKASPANGRKMREYIYAVAYRSFELFRRVSYTLHDMQTVIRDMSRRSQKGGVYLHLIDTKTFKEELLCMNDGAVYSKEILKEYQFRLIESRVEAIHNNAVEVSWDLQNQEEYSFPTLPENGHVQMTLIRHYS